GLLCGWRRVIRGLFDAALDAGAAAPAAFTWRPGEVTAWRRRTEGEPSNLTGVRVAALIELVDTGVVSATAAKEVLEGVLAGEGEPRAVAEARDLVQVSD